jgi:hypothetical protein
VVAAAVIRTRHHSQSTPQRRLIRSSDELSTLGDFRGVIFVNASSRGSAEFGLQIAVDSRERHAEKTHFISAGSGRR